MLQPSNYESLLLDYGTDELEDVDHIGGIRDEAIDVNHREQIDGQSAWAEILD
jgi:hypothetical protein